mgnify:CR=1 FL=1
MKSDRVNLVDMLQAAQKIKSFLDGVSEAEFLNNPALIAAASFELLAMGEASKDLSDRTRRAIPGVPWADLRLVRNMVAHEHNVLNPRTLWRTLVNDIPHIAQTISDGIDNLR